MIRVNYRNFKRKGRESKLEKVDSMGKLSLTFLHK